VFGSAHVGAGTPLGAAGLEAGVGNEVVRGAIGAGLGLRGTQLSVMGHATTDVLGPTVGLGLGVSRGAAFRITGDDWEDEHDEVHYGPETVWGNVEVMVEYGFHAHGAVRLYAGASHAVTPDCVLDGPGVCDAEQGRVLDDASWIPYAGVAVVLRSTPGRVVQMPAYLVQPY